MKILHSGSLDTNTGGPAMSTYYTLLGLRELGEDTSIIMYPLSKDGQLRGTEVPVHFAAPPIDPKLLYSFHYKNEIRTLGDYDIYHAQGIWQYPTYAIADVAKEKNKPYLITPRGMLYPQDIAKSNKFFKMLSLKIRLLRDLNQAACVHVTCEDEMVHCRQLGVTSPIAIIPNPVEIKDYPYQKTDKVFRLGYLGRLSPRKNVQGLIYAFAELGDEARNAELLIIGGGDETYEHFLKTEAERLGLKNVRFVGFLSGEEKDRAIASCSVLAMPSEFENLGNVILEGLVRGIPCIATQGAPWKELETHRCGWWVAYKQAAITEAVRTALHTSVYELQEMGKNGRKLMESAYSIEAVALKMKKLYQWILKKGDKPDFVYQ